MTVAKPKPRLVQPQTERKPGSTPDWAKGIRRGAIIVRRAQADECRRLACDAGLAGDDGRAFMLHCEADQAEDAIQSLSEEIAGIR